MEQNQQNFLGIYETVISVHSNTIDFLLAHLTLTPKNPYFTVWSGIRSLLMSDNQFLNFKKSKFSHQVTLVGKDGFIFKCLI